MSRVSSNGDVGKVEDSGGGFILFGDGFLGAHLNYDGKTECNSFMLIIWIVSNKQRPHLSMVFK